MKANHLALLFLFLVLGMAAAQETNWPPQTLGGMTFGQAKAKAEKGDAQAQDYLGLFCTFPGGATNWLEAVKWFRKAAEQGNAHAQQMLGMVYRYGTAGAVGKDNNEAAVWYLRAAKQGDDQSQMELAEMYEDGDGVIQDYIEAYKWLNLAATSTFKPPATDVGALPPDEREAMRPMAEKAKEARDKLAQIMTPDQIAEAQRRSAEFVPRSEMPSNNSTSPDNPFATGTGFFITDDGYLISNYYMVKDATKVHLLTSAGWIDANVVQVDAANDLALLKADGRFAPLPISDKQVAQQKLNKLIQELEHESAGLIPAKGEREAAQSPLLDLVSEYVNELTVLGRSADHLRHVDKRLRRLVRECGWTRLADVTPASFQLWRKEQAYKAPKTLNEYLATLSAFWTWLRKQSRVKQGVRADLFELALNCRIVLHALLGRIFQLTRTAQWGVI